MAPEPVDATRIRGRIGILNVISSPTGNLFSARRMVNCVTSYSSLAVSLGILPFAASNLAHSHAGASASRPHPSAPPPRSSMKPLETAPPAALAILRRTASQRKSRGSQAQGIDHSSNWRGCCMTGYRRSATCAVRTTTSAIAAEQPFTGATRQTVPDPDQTVGLLRSGRSTDQLGGKLRRRAKPRTPRNDPSLNHLVRTLQQHLRDSQAERLGGLEIDR
jgi:hypothetical protein